MYKAIITPLVPSSDPSCISCNLKATSLKKKNMFYYKQTMSSIGSPQASTCANDAVLREGHQSINSHLARRLWNLSFYAKKKRPKVMEHQLLLTFISSKSTRSSGEVIIRPKIFHNNFLRKKKKKSHLHKFTGAREILRRGDLCKALGSDRNHLRLKLG